MQPSEAEIKAFEERIRAQYTGKQAPRPARKSVEDVPAEQRPQSYSVRSSVDISKPSNVERPNIKDQSGKVVSPKAKISSPSGSAYSNHDAQRIALERVKAEEAEAQKGLTNEALLNRLGAQERIMKKMQKEIAELKKQA